MRHNNRHISRKATPWDDESNKTPVQEFLIQHYQQHYEDKHQSLKDTEEAELINSFIPETCPYCSSPDFRKYGITKNDIQRYQCILCKKTFTPVTNTIFDGHKISISEWIEYTLNLLRYISITADSWNNRNAFTTSRYWLQKLFLILEDYQDDILLGGRVWLDETYYPVRSNDMIKTPAGLKLRGTSQNQLCIGVACTKQQIVCLFEGNGRPSKRKTYNAFKDHIMPESVLVHDKDAAHCLLISDLNLKSESYDSKVIKKLLDKDNPLNRVNQVHARLKDFLNAHSGFNRDNLQGYLNLFSFAMNPPHGYLEKVDELISLALNTSKVLKYRDFYNIMS